MSNRLYVGNLSFDATRDDLQDLFATAGSVREATIIEDRNTGKSRGFAFVMMSSDEEATRRDYQIQWACLSRSSSDRKRSEAS